MKESIYIIPVMDALKDPGECPFCAMYAGLENSTINSLMGPSVAYMEDYVREATDEQGFCPGHYDRLAKSKNPLGLALVLHTHFVEINKQLNWLYQKQSGRKKGLLNKTKGDTPLAEYLQKLENTCYICNLMEKSYGKYLDTFFGLFSEEEEARDLLKSSKGVCLPHLSEIMDLAPKKLKDANLKLFYDMVFMVQRFQMEKIEADLDWFVKKFDYRNQKEPWKDSKDATDRAILRLYGIKSNMVVKEGRCGEGK